MAQEMLKLFDDRILLRVHPHPSQISKGGIHLPDTAANSRRYRATVIATGPGKRRTDDPSCRIKPEIEIGMEVTIKWLQEENWIEVNNDRLYICNESEIEGCFRAS